ncbi:multidrug efflux RND transporter permease subunit [Chitinophaga polysaccharea]|uniref:efflux RND transporter permease subunit n=1 Tax=Chitinophaga TaxID=79328 RepID=UPI0014556CE7|nr:MULTISPECIES: multidrug efflux RND transporter permease subunit [Chitinophaga]NLR58965.1 multidrug efflux RND transporter permease subunit [Chitinophaga polysaccharea]NLU92250.1 multidrug efflux RND transporter permease subunit [Chitinophaga sp. Ak27]
MISKTFIERKNTTIVIAIIIVIVGLICMFNLPIAQLPDIAPPVTDVRANYVGANSTTVEETVTTPIENQVNGTPGAMYIQSVSANDGSMSITVTFKLGTNPDISTLDVQNRVSLALPSTPDEVRRVGVTVKKRSNDMLMVIALNSPKGKHSREFLDNYLNIYLKPELARISGVGDVNAFSQDYSMRIWLNPDKMAALGLTAGDISRAITEQNQQVPAGSVGAPPMGRSQAFEYTVSVKGRLATSEEFGNVVVATSPNGGLVRLRDVARIDLGSFTYAIEAKADGKTGSGMAIYLSPGANALDVNDRVIAKMKDMAKSFPDDVNWLIPFETTSFVKISIDEVIQTFIEALVLVVIVVFVFLQNWRATLIPILVIPISLIGTFIFFQLLGFSINTLTLFGFVLAIGIVVDDAIVVVEAVQHHIDADLMSPREATFKAMAEVSAPVIAIALILAAVFVPVAFIPGVSGRLYQQFALTIAFSVLLSAFLALTLTPALTAILLRPAHLTKQSHGLNKLFFKFNEWFGRFTNRYGNGVKHSIRFTPAVLIILGVLFAIAAFLFKKTPTTFVPQEDMGALFIALELPEASSTERTKEVVAEISNILTKDSAVSHFFGITGINFVANATKPNSGTFFVSLKPWDERYAHGDNINTVLGRIQGAAGRIIGANVICIPAPTLRGLGTSGGFSFILEQRSNPDINQFLQVMGQFLMAANQRPEIARAYAFFSANTPQFNVEVDRDKCKQLGVAVSDVFNALQTFLGGLYVNDFTKFSRSFRVVLQADSLYRTSINNLNTYYVRNNNGQMVPLSALITTKKSAGAPVINHFNLYRSVEIDGDSKTGYSSGDAINALKEVAASVLPENFSYEWANVSLQEIEAGNSSLLIFGLSILFVFLLLTALYESWSVPFSVLLAVPVALFGSIVALSLTKQANSVYSQIGLITLIGLAAKNAILIVEFCKERVDRGMPLLEATLEAVKLRLRPILMTSFAFILGVLPLCLAKGAGAASRVNIGFTVVGGMLAATLLGIFTVPVLYVLITKLAYGKKKLAELEAHGNEEKKPKGLGE